VTTALVAARAPLALSSPPMRLGSPSAARSALAALAAIALAACEPAPDGTGTWVGLLGSSEILSRVDHFRVWAYDSAVQRCSGDAVPDPRAAALASTGDVAVGDTTRLEVPAGERTFYAEAYGSPGSGDVIATGCAEEALAAGQHAAVVIRLAETGGDGGDGDGDGDADVPDARDDGADGDADAADEADAADDAPEIRDDGDDVPDDADAPADAVIDAGPPLYYSTSFLPADCALWTIGRVSASGVADWQCGNGTGTPDSGHDVAGGVLATGIGRAYSARADGYAESPAINTLTGTGPLRLQFWQWFQTEGYAGDCTGASANNDGGLVAVSTGGAPFATDGVAPADGYPYLSIDATFSGGPAFVNGRPGFACRSGRPLPAAPDVAWQRECFDLSAFRAGDLRIRFYFGSGADAIARGWYVDELALEDGACP